MPPDHPEYLDRYRILDLLGRGSMGDVYLAVDPKFERRIALKVMSAHRLGLDDELQDLKQRFVHEALAAGRLNHPDIVTIHDADTDRATGWPFIAMEWVEGESLRARLRRAGPLSVDQALKMAARVAKALDYAHRQGVVHRDIKPANLLLRQDDLRPKIADFGVAKLVSSSLTLTGQVLGSPNYMSPEQVKAESVDGRTDLFALGGVLYESLAGRPAFAADSLASITFKIVNVDPRPLGMYNPNIPEALQELLTRALAKDPADRFPTGIAMAESLEGLAAEFSAQPSRSRPATKELTLPAGMPDAHLAESGRRTGETLDIKPISLTSDGESDTALTQPPATDSTKSGSNRTPLFRYAPFRYAPFRYSTVGLVAVIIGFLAARLWLDPTNSPDLSTLTRSLGIFEPVDSEPLDQTASSDQAAEAPGASPSADRDIEQNVAPANAPAPEGTASGDTTREDRSQEERSQEDGALEDKAHEDRSSNPTKDRPQRLLDGIDTTARVDQTLQNGSIGSPQATDSRAKDSPTVSDPETPPIESNSGQTAVDPERVPENTPEKVEETPAKAPTKTEPAKAAIVKPPPKQKPKPALVPVTIALDKRVKLAYISVWVDGRKVKSRRLEAGSWVRRLAGQSYEFEIQVPAGERKIEAHVSGLSTSLEARGKIIADFEPGKPKTLWVEINRSPDKLQLSWRNP